MLNQAYSYSMATPIPDGRKVCMFLRVQFPEGKTRRKFFDKLLPQTVYVFTSRIKCAMNGDFEATKGSAALYAWFVREKEWKGESKYGEVDIGGCKSIPYK